MNLGIRTGITSNQNYRQNIKFGNAAQSGLTAVQRRTKSNIEFTEFRAHCLLNNFIKRLEESASAGAEKRTEILGGLKELFANLNSSRQFPLMSGDSKLRMMENVIDSQMVKPASANVESGSGRYQSDLFFED